MLTDNVRSKLSALSRRLEEIDRMLAAPETAADMNLFRDLSRERGEIEPIVGRLHAYERQIERLHTDERIAMLSALSQVGAVFAGRYVTNAVVLTAVKQLGARWAAGRAAKWVPIAGQGAAAALSFWAVVRLGDAHIAECLRVREQVRALLTAPSSSEIP